MPHVLLHCWHKRLLEEHKELGYFCLTAELEQANKNILSVSTLRYMCFWRKNSYYLNAFLTSWAFLISRYLLGSEKYAFLQENIFYNP